MRQDQALYEQGYSLNLSSQRRFALVLSCSDRDDQNGHTQEYASDILGWLSAQELPAIHALGSEQRLSRAVFHQECARWQRANNSRLSLLRPVLRTLNPSELDAVIVVTHRLPHDIDDFRETPWDGKLWVASVSGDMGRHDTATLNAPRSPHRVISREDLSFEVRNAIESVTIDLNQGVPLCWDNPLYEWRDGQLRAQGNALSKWSCNLTLLHCQGVEPRASVTRKNQSVTAVSLIQGTASCPQRMSGALTSAERTLLENALHKQDYTCPHCGETHSWSQTRCRRPDELGLGSLVYPSIEAEVGSQYVGPIVLRVAESSVDFETCPNSTCRVATDLVVHLDKELVLWVYTYSPSDARWTRQRRDRLDPYTWFGQQAYVVGL